MSTDQQSDAAMSLLETRIPQPLPPPVERPTLPPRRTFGESMLYSHSIDRQYPKRIKKRPSRRQKRPSRERRISLLPLIEAAEPPSEQPTSRYRDRILKSPRLARAVSFPLVVNWVAENRLTRRTLELWQTQRNQPTISRLHSWDPLNGPEPVPRQDTWAEFLSKCFRFGNQPFLDELPGPIWRKELSFEKGDDGTLQQWLDELEDTEFLGLEEGKIWHTLMSVLHALLWLHRGRTFQDRNWYLSNTLATPLNLSWKPVVHGRIEPRYILYSKSTQARRPYGDTKLFVLPHAPVLSSLQHDICRDDLHDRDNPIPRDTMYMPPELLWLETKGIPIEPQGAKSDLWSIGAVCVRMMGGPKNEGQSSGLTSKERALETCLMMREMKNLPMLQADGLPEEYSQFLRAAVASLVVFHPYQRPDIEQAIQFAREQFVQWRRVVNLSKPSRANDDSTWINESLYKNRALRQAPLQQQPVQGNEHSIGPA